jgi:hypothetical protein
MRNAILVADTSVYGGRHRAGIWKVFASRGMGFYAGSFGGNDSRPAASTDLPPATLDLQEITGKVTDAVTHLPVAGMTVRLAFQGAGVANPVAVTDNTGTYVIHDVPVGHYGKVQVSGKGYHAARKPVTVVPGGTTLNFAVGK